MTRLKLAIGQINATVGDINGNSQLVEQRLRDAQAAGADLAIFPELALTGYPPEDLILKPGFVRDNLAALKRLAKLTGATAAIVGFVDSDGSRCYNAAAWLEQGRVRGIYHKHCLPNYGVFDENRYFVPGTTPFVRDKNGFRIGLTICEDIWLGPAPLRSLSARRPDVVINISASPYHSGKIHLRHRVAADASNYLKAPLVYCNLVGGQDELVFDGGSFAVLPGKKRPAQWPLFKDGIFYGAVEKAHGKTLIYPDEKPAKLPVPSAEITEALVVGLRDYVNKNGFRTVTLGLSGGIDSALVAAIAVRALGPERVVCVTMPSRFNTSATRGDAAKLAENLKTRLIEIPIQAIHEHFLSALAPTFSGSAPGLTEENIQARIRGTLLMALSNKFGWLVLTTGNKSETSTGYSTLYGDTAGGFAILKDLLKTTVYALAEFLNEEAGRELIPTSIITRPPTAELRDNQKDEDSLGRYADLDPVIVDYIEKNRSLEQMSRARGRKASYVARVMSMIDRAEYKRRQAPPGIKITPRSFGRDHRMPITNAYRPYAGALAKL